MDTIDVQDGGGVFPPEKIDEMQAALNEALSTLPEPVKAHTVQMLAHSILRLAQERNCGTKELARLALLELQIR
ncbi:hypothetical protein [Bradyrhizobium sp. SYSU BS000235]|uniref:hypothetical protein n=1 Tax=Bradyrhizobium sp. SYSU BS000235 TaxID=3411332 RepID=UPI003C732F86